MMRVTQRKTASGRWTKYTVFWKLFRLAAKQKEKTVSLGLLCDPQKLEILRIEKNQIKEEIPMFLSSFVFFFQSKEKLRYSIQNLIYFHKLISRLTTPVLNHCLFS